MTTAQRGPDEGDSLVEDSPDIFLDHAYTAEPGKISDLGVSIVAHISGFVARSLLLRLNCSECSSALKVSTAPPMPAYSLIRRKTQGGLIYASSDVLTICKQTEAELRRALVYYSFPSKGFVAKVVVNTLTAFVGKDFFKALDQHMLENHPLECHSSHLVRAIVEKYLDVRLRHLAKTTTERLHQERIRQKHTKLTQFKGQ